nr:MAG TPA: hypothetical protein [Caudoviricetes sp.]
MCSFVPIGLQLQTGLSSHELRGEARIGPFNTCRGIW